MFLLFINFLILEKLYVININNDLYKILIEINLTNDN